MAYYYQAFGLVLKSEIVLSELLSTTPKEADIEIVWGNVPQKLENPGARGVVFEGNESQFLFRVKDIAAYLVEDGSRITVERFERDDEELLKAYLLGAVLGSVLCQRGYFLLHASVMDTEKGAVAFCGRSGAGKSTLAALFERKGYRLLGDDICAIRYDEENKLLVYPAYPQMKLWYDTLRKLERSVEDNMQQIGRERMKYGIVDPEKFQPEPRPLSKIFVVSGHNKTEFIRTEVKGMEKIRVLRNQFYGQRFLKAGFDVNPHFNILSRIASEVSVVQVIRPLGNHNLDEWYSFVKEELDA